MLHRLQHISARLALSAFLFATGLTVLILLILRQTHTPTTALPARDLLPASWTVTETGIFRVGVPKSWELNQSRVNEGVWTIDDDRGTPVITITNITTTRSVTLTELDHSNPEATFPMRFADHPATRYVFADHETYIIAAGKNAYRLDAPLGSDTVAILLTTLRWL